MRKIKKYSYCRPLCKRGCFLPTQSWIQKVWNPVNTGNWGTGWPCIKGQVIFVYNTGYLNCAIWSWLLLTKRGNLYIVPVSCHAVAHGSSFSPAGPGCGESGKTQAKPCTHQAFQSLKEDILSLILKHCTISHIAGMDSTQQLKCSQNQSKIKLVFPKLWGGDMRNMSKLKCPTTSPIAQMFHTMLLWQFNYSVSWLHYCLFASVR